MRPSSSSSTRSFSVATCSSRSRRRCAISVVPCAVSCDWPESGRTGDPLAPTRSGDDDTSVNERSSGARLRSSASSDRLKSTSDESAVSTRPGADGEAIPASRSWRIRAASAGCWKRYVWNRPNATRWPWRSCTRSCTCLPLTSTRGSSPCDSRFERVARSASGSVGAAPPSAAAASASASTSASGLGCPVLPCACVQTGSAAPNGTRYTLPSSRLSTAACCGATSGPARTMSCSLADGVEPILVTPGRSSYSSTSAYSGSSFRLRKYGRLLSSTVTLMPIALNAARRCASSFSLLRILSSHVRLSSAMRRSLSFSWSLSWLTSLSGEDPAVALLDVPPFCASCSRRRVISSLSSRMMRAFASSFTTARLTMFFALLAYRSVLSDSSKLIAAGLIVATMIVFEFPPRLSLSSHVSTESRYGTNGCLLLRGSDSASALMTSPSVLSDLLILAPSLSRSPVVPLLPARSLPARSTRLILLVFSLVIFTSGSYLTCVSTSVKIACDRLLSAFIAVAATVRALLPSSIRRLMSVKLATSSLDRSSTYGPRTGCSRTLHEWSFMAGLSRSLTFSL
eukprot:Unigene3677_Nuclearia_a/m.11212 Unigene3677_Nuclearia_a/g.11212  ORF Unigene3677_Nuclearia_a/g.11212 Unigene3677_Nuclearia_a/m.11212 type:complete len:570 (+) Unigene3677_Nuclearia_a:1-1710(+)